METVSLPTETLQASNVEDMYVPIRGLLYITEGLSLTLASHRFDISR